DREVLAALVPERVLPFASGDSRKRWPGPKKPQWSAGRRAAGNGRGCACLVRARPSELDAPFGAPLPFFLS
ncbi:MAG TPA: hypothetical protein VMJ52_00055, partial [Xanthobacteraceae bacterium]|nr:hypothetical protein [Xanthobacteraceae bacterium]